MEENPLFEAYLKAKEQELRESTNALALRLKICYDAFREQGFSEHEAIELTKFVVEQSGRLNK